VLALFLLLLFGSFSDRVNTKLGKRTPFILAGTIIAVSYIPIGIISSKLGRKKDNFGRDCSDDF